MQTRAPAAACATRGEGSPWVWTADPFGAGVVFSVYQWPRGPWVWTAAPGGGGFFQSPANRLAPGVGRRSSLLQILGERRVAGDGASLLAGHWFFSLDQGPGGDWLWTADLLGAIPEPNAGILDPFSTGYATLRKAFEDGGLHPPYLCFRRRRAGKGAGGGRAGHRYETNLVTTWVFGVRETNSLFAKRTPSFAKRTPCYGRAGSRRVR